MGDERPTSAPTRTGAQKSRLCKMGGLDKRTGVAKLGVYIVTEGDFRDHPKVAAERPSSSVETKNFVNIASQTGRVSR
jgi:hypothetical protein